MLFGQFTRRVVTGPAFLIIIYAEKGVEVQLFRINMIKIHAIFNVSNL